MPAFRLSFNTLDYTLRQNLFSAQIRYRDAAIPASTGLRINTLSDDAPVLPQLFSLKNQSSVNEQYQLNVSSARVKLTFTDSQLEQASTLLQGIRDLALRGNDGATTASSLTQIGNQITDLQNQLLDLSNVKLDGRYIFSGTATSTAPFSGTPVVFNGNSGSILAQITSTLTLQTNLDGNALFTGSQATAAGATLASILRSSDGVPLNIATGDVITIAGSVGGVAMAGQTLAVTATTTLANIATAVQNALRSVADGDLTETAAVQADGSIQVASDLTHAITNLTLSISGKTAFNTAFTYSTPIAAAGATAKSDLLKSGATENVFDLISDLRTALLAQNPTNVATHLARLDSGIAQVLDQRSAIGIRLQQLDSVESQLGDERLRLSDRISGIEEVDISQAASQMVIRETALKIIFASTSQVLSTISNVRLQL